MNTENSKRQTVNLPFARPLAPVVLALLWLALGALWLARHPARFLPMLFFALIGVACYQQAPSGPPFRPTI